MEPVEVLAIATAIYAAMLAATYVIMLKKSPPEYRKPKLKEVLVILLAPALFFALTYLLIWTILQLK